LAVQPSLAILTFAHYGEHGFTFSEARPALLDHAKHLAKSFRGTLGMSPDEVVFIGRIGEPYRRSPRFRSGRLSLEALMADPPSRPESSAADSPGGLEFTR